MKTNKTFYEIPFRNNDNAKLTTQVNPCVRIIDGTFIQYFDTPFPGFHQYWDNIKTFFDEMPNDAVGKFLQSNLKIIDYWEIYAFPTSSCMEAIVSQRFVDSLLEAGVKEDEFILKDISIVNNKSGINYFILFVPAYRDEHIIYPESTFEHIIRSSVFRNFASEQERIASGPFENKWTVADESIRDLGIVRFRSCYYIYLSEHVIEIMHKNGINGIRPNPDHYIIVKG